VSTSRHFSSRGVYDARPLKVALSSRPGVLIDTESRTALTPTLEQRHESSNVLLID
jgi:hypothetical protein